MSRALRRRLWRGVPRLARGDGELVVMARVAAALFGAGATLLLVTLVLPSGPEHHRAVLAGLAGAAYAAGALCAALAGRLPLWAFQLFVALGTGLATAVVALAGESAHSYQLFYVWIGLYVGYFFSRPAAALQVGLVVLAHGLAFALRPGPGVGGDDVAVTAGTVVVAAALVSFLKGRLERLLATERGQVAHLRELDRLKDELVALVSHELRTPITSIKGYLELVLDGEAGELADEQHRLLAVVARNAERLNGLVEELLAVTQIEAGKLQLALEPVRLGDVVAEGVEAARPGAEAKGVRVELQAKSLPRLVGDRGRLAQVVDNLLSNAIKFTSEGGRVDVRLVRRDGAAVLEVADTGIGIPAAEQEHLFERFFRSSSANRLAIQGTGLGLTIAKAIVEAHGGTISGESEEGRGTTFRVELPLVPGAVAAGRALEVVR